MTLLDPSKPFIPLNIAVLTISDSRALADDKSGTTLADRITAAGHHLAAREIVTDDVEKIQAQLKRWIADDGVDVVVTTGGTGFTGRDVTPEAVEPLFDKRMDGFSIAFHMLSHAKIGTSTIQSRATAGVAGTTARTIGKRPVACLLLAYRQLKDTIVVFPRRPPPVTIVRQHIERLVGPDHHIA